MQTVLKEAQLIISKQRQTLMLYNILARADWNEMQKMYEVNYQLKVNS